MKKTKIDKFKKIISKYIFSRTNLNERISQALYYHQNSPQKEKNISGSLLILSIDAYSDGRSESNLCKTLDKFNLFSSENYISLVNYLAKFFGENEEVNNKSKQEFANKGYLTIENLEKILKSNQVWREIEFDYIYRWCEYNKLFQNYEPSKELQEKIESSLNKIKNSNNPQ